MIRPPAGEAATCAPHRRARRYSSLTRVTIRPPWAIIVPNSLSEDPPYRLDAGSGFLPQGFDAGGGVLSQGVDVGLDGRDIGLGRKVGVEEGDVLFG